ncbi:MAG: caspase family protein [Candidatus Sulfotelmatobacter sp.]|jgi:hypothetical protein
MEARALIVAIENYSQAQGLFTQTLEGTLDSARRFYDWLLTEKRVKPECIFLCSDNPIASSHPANRPNRAGEPGKVTLIRAASRADIIAACLDLIELGQDETTELFVFFSGHGLAYRESPWRLAFDVLICSDFRDFRQSGAAGIKLNELRVRLCTCLGGTDHYFLIDACRNVVDKSQFQPIGLGISPTTAQLGTPTVYTLYSVKFGEPAPVNEKFAKALLKGLYGDGHAKGWVQGEMFVKFDLLRDYVKDQVKPRQIDYRQDGDGRGALLQLPAPVTSHCEVVVVDASPEQKFHLAVTSGSASILATDFSGSSFTTTLEPNDRTYALQVMGDGDPWEQFEPPLGTPLDMYSDTTVKFRKKRIDRGPAAPKPPSTGQINIVFSPEPTFAGPPPNWALQLRNLRSGELFEKPSSFSKSVAPGKYLAKLLENGVTAFSTQFEVSPGEEKTVDLLSREPTAFQQSMLEQIVGRPGAKVPDFSEALGPSAHWNPQLWLGYLGGAHILREPGTYRRLAKIPLTPLDPLQENGSGFFVLGVVEGSAPQVALGTGNSVSWTPMESVAGVPTLYQVKLPVSAGSALFSIKFGEFPPITYSTCALPNRVTFISVTKQADADLEIQQFILPPAEQQRSLPAQLQWATVPASDLKVIQFMSLAQTRFAKRKSIAPKADHSEPAKIWQTVLAAKWTDPILSVIALYEMVRQGAVGKSPTSAKAVLDELQQCFPEIPDVAVLNHLVYKSQEQPAGTPLFLEGILSSPEANDTMALSSDRLDFNSVWTTWRDAVKAEDEGAANVMLSAGL